MTPNKLLLYHHHEDGKSDFNWATFFKRLPSKTCRLGIDLYNHHSAMVKIPQIHTRRKNRHDQIYIRDKGEITLTLNPLTLTLTLTPCATVLSSEDRVFGKKKRKMWIGKGLSSDTKPQLFF